MKNNIKEYDIGVDIGTNSVGWVVTDMESHILKFKKKNMWGSRVFEAGQTAQDRRVSRSTRRRYNRRKERIRLLQEICAPMILPQDENFFRRLKEGFLYSEDKQIEAAHILFDDFHYTDQDYYADPNFKTIYHTRKYLMTCKEKADPRMIYLALHHIIKYRGHFLYQGQKFSEISGSILNILIDMFTELREQQNVIVHFEEKDLVEIQEKLKSNEITKKIKQEQIADVLCRCGLDKKYATELTKFILGYKANMMIVFANEQLKGENGKAKSCSFIDTTYEESEEEILEIVPEMNNFLFLVKKIYSWMVLQGVLQGESNLSEAMIKKYNKHGEDLALLKEIIKKYAFDEYSNFFRIELDKNEKPLKNYLNYIKGEKRCNREELYNSIKKILANVEDERVNAIKKDMEEEQFLLLINSKDNSAIPYQLNELEMKAIIKNQKRYYPELKENEDKIISIFEFKIPYYVGPLNKASQFAWIERKEGKIYPWNFSEMIDEDETAERFIRRMTNKCTYLTEKDVIPRHSLLYTKFVLLNELNKIKINGKWISTEDKKCMIEELFETRKTITDKGFKSYLTSINYQNMNEFEITGYQKENAFASTLSSYIDFKKIFGEINAENKEMIEELIYWLTVFEEKEIVKRKIRNKYSKEYISDEQLKKIMKIRYQGWSNLSKELLTDIRTTACNGERLSIMDVLETTNLNLMQIINDKEYDFAKIIEESNGIEQLDEIKIEEVNHLQGSPAIKRGIWQTVKIVKEIVEIMGCEPKNIFIEFAREDGKKQRSTSRVNNLKKCYQKMKEETKEYNQQTAKDLANKKYADRLDEEKLFLYFIQNGKSMYSGKPLDIDNLSRYEVDHIIPRAYIKDDSIENKVLVLKEENQWKTDKLLIGYDVQKKMKTFWNELYKCNLIDNKKYYNLLKETVSERDVKGFVNRQLVETRQISKHVANLLSECYINSNISTIKANISSQFRDKYELKKMRELNDYHHAHDALLAVTIGSYIMKRFPNLEEELIYNDFKKYYSDANNQRKNMYGYVMAMFDKKTVTEDGEIIWEGQSNIDYIRKAFMFKDCQVTKKLEELTGEYYNQLPVAKSETKSLIPLKKGLDPKKYGGYTGKNNAYFDIVMFQKKGKKVKKLVGIPCYIAAIAKKDKITILNYLQSELKCAEIEILKEHILKYQLIEEDGNLLYLTSDSEVINAKQLCFEQGKQKYINTLAKCKNNAYKEEEEKQLSQELDEIFDYLAVKLKKNYFKFSADLERIFAVEFNKYTFEEKKGYIMEILKLTKANADYPYLAKYGLVDRLGRKASYNLKADKTVFIDQSITGLFERRYYI